MIPCFHVSSQNTKQKVVAMETQYKLAARSAQLLAKDAPQDEAARVTATVAMAKSHLSKVGIISGQNVRSTMKSISLMKARHLFGKTFLKS